jgi:hypothetical protein
LLHSGLVVDTGINIEETEKLENSHLCLQMTNIPRTAEGTKVGRPDEFDFVLCLDKLNEITEIVVTKSCLETGYACLKFTETPVKEEYLSFADKDGYFLAFPFLQYLFRYLRRITCRLHVRERDILRYV